VQPFQLIHVLLLALLCAGCLPQGNAMSQTDKIEWDSLNFTCKKEVNPPLDPEADSWYRHARELQKTDEDKYIQTIVSNFKKAIERKHYNAMHRLALLYVEGAEGFAPNERKAVDLVEQVIELNVPSGYFQMGVFLEQGIGVKQDRKAALTYMRKAADMGNPQGQLAVGKKLLAVEGREVRAKTLPIGKAMLECALSQGLGEAGYLLSFHVLIADKDAERSLRLLQAAAALGHNQSLYSLFSAFSNGEDGAPKDSQRAACYEKLLRQSNEDKSKRFPDIDRICPLPPAPMPST
jgi:uncharacterized protein